MKSNGYSPAPSASTDLPKHTAALSVPDAAARGVSRLERRRALRACAAHHDRTADMPPSPDTAPDVNVAVNVGPDAGSGTRRGYTMHEHDPVQLCRIYICSAPRGMEYDYRAIAVYSIFSVGNGRKHRRAHCDESARVSRLPTVPENRAHDVAHVLVQRMATLSPMWPRAGPCRQQCLCIRGADLGEPGSRTRRDGKEAERCRAKEGRPRPATRHKSTRLRERPRITCE
jgi:hypothetical protein